MKKNIKYFMFFILLTILFIPSVSASCSCKSKATGKEMILDFNNMPESCDYYDFTVGQKNYIVNNCEAIKPPRGHSLIYCWETGKEPAGVKFELENNNGSNNNGGNVSAGDVGDKLECSDIAELIDELAKIYNILKICLTAGLVVLSMLDFTKAVMSSDDDALKKAQKHLITRIIILVIIFILPVLIDWVIGMADIEGLDSSCIKNL